VTVALSIRDRTRPTTAGYFLGATEGAGLLDWNDTARRFAAARNYWVSTASSAGRPHTMPVWGVWLGDRFLFSTSPESRKARNLHSNPQVSVHLEDGDAVVIIEGCATEVDDPRALAAFLDIYNPKYQWDFTLAQVARGVFDVRPERAFAWLGSEGASFGGTATRWRFTPSDATEQS
jgi:hypothetical protein